MADTEDALESEVEEFLRQADAVYEEYDQGYVDADASLRQLRRHLDDLRAATGDD